jgi:hypothetical protein
VLGRRSKQRQALSVDQSRRSGGCGAIAFFGLFFAAGSGMLYFMTLRPLGSVLLARNWDETPCRIVSSDVEAGSDGDTFKIVIRYTYDYDGRAWTSERYNFMFDMYSSGRAGKQQAVRNYPPGRQAVCYVNPGNPSEAVLNRGLTADMWWGLFPLPFFLVGAGGLLACTGVIRFNRSKRRGAALSTGVSSDTRANSPLTTTSDDGPRVLKETVSPLAKFIGVLAITVFANGIVSVFVWQAIESFRRGRPEWFLTIFMIPFVAAGLGMLAWTVHSFLAIFNPRPILTLSRGRIPLGESAKLEWKFSGSTHAIRALKVSLKGQEQATYRRGTRTYTDKEAFHEEVLFESIDSLHIAEGETEIHVPSDTMHTFAASRNKVVWTVQFAGEIPLRPDVSSEFPIEVSPHEPTQY